jgi:hypothetical protein
MANVKELALTVVFFFLLPRILQIPQFLSTTHYSSHHAGLQGGQNTTYVPPPPTSSAILQ